MFSMHDIDVTVLGEYETSDGSMVNLVHEYAKNIKLNSYGYRIRTGFTYHRVGEPAYMAPDGHITWDFEGVEYGLTHHYCKVCGFDEETTLIWVLKYGDELPNHIDKL